MKRPAQILVCLSLLFNAWTPPPAPPIGSVEVISPDLLKLIDRNAKVEIIAAGFEWSEGPVWVQAQHALLVSDVPKNIIYKWTEQKGKQVYLSPSGYTGTEPRKGEMGSNGLTVSGGKLFLCQSGDRRVSVMNAPLDLPRPDFKPVAPDYKGKKFNSPNDLVVDASGSVYFTDPPYGLEGYMTDPKKELEVQGVYKAKPNGQVIQLIDSLDRPNGIAITADGKTLIVANSGEQKKKWYAYDIGPNDSLFNARVFCDASADTTMGACDGLKIDHAGNIFATGPGGVWIFDRSGKLLGKIRVHGVPTSNCALTTDDKTLFITADMYVLRVKLR